MIIFPAIDLKGGQCVRLRQGRAEDATVYADDPVRMALHWVEQGATYLHVVDLDGAFRGEPVHTEIIRKIAAAINIPVQVGGGLRKARDVDALLEHGVQRAIIGTRAVSGSVFVAELAAKYGDRIVVGIDARDGLVQVSGWVDAAELTAIALAGRLQDVGIQTIVYTDISRDGMLNGVNTAATDAMCAAVPGCSIIASGGVSSLADVQALRALGRPNLAGAIVGKALYEGRVTVRDLRVAAEEKQ